jgi:hypothetical protein
MRTTIFLRTFWCGVLITGMLALPALGAEDPSRKPEPFACEIRYHFRENIRDATAGEKQVSASSHEREVLPLSRAIALKGVFAQEVQGQVKSLPYKFLIRVTRGRGAETLKVNVLDDSRRPLPGFPKLIANPLTRTGDSSRKDFEIAISEPLKKEIERSLLAKDQFLTYVSLIVGMDDDFLSSARAR